MSLQPISNKRLWEDEPERAPVPSPREGRRHLFRDYLIIG